MKDHVVASRYTDALFAIDLKEGILEKRMEDFDFIMDLHKHPKLEHLLLAPQLKNEDKKEILFSLLHGRLDSTFLKFLSLLIEKRRWAYLTEIVRLYRRKVDKHLGIWEAEIITAVPIDEKTEEALMSKLKHTYPKIKLKKKVDPSLIGGATLLIENRMLDWSLAGKLKRMKKNLLNGGK